MQCSDSNASHIGSAGKRIFFAWEFGANYGHLARDLPIANKLRMLGHDVMFAVRDLRIAQEILGPAGFLFVQAPLPTQDGLGRPPINYSEMLLASGYADTIALQARVNAWNSLYSLYGAQVVVINHAPTALLAAHVTGIPAALTSIGFELPPNIEPLPSIRSWESIPVVRLQQADSVALHSINSVLTTSQRAPLCRVADLFANIPTALTTFPELDHYGARLANYVGPVSALTETTHCTWPNRNRKLIFAYVRPSIPGFEHLLAALRDTDASVLCVAPGISRETITRFSSPYFLIHTKPINLRAAFKEADLAVVYGTGTMADALLAGIPLLLVPQVVEQALAAERIEALGAGISWKPPRTQKSIQQILDIALNSDAMKHAARAFAAAHASYSHDTALNAVINVVLNALNGPLNSAVNFGSTPA